MRVRRADTFVMGIFRTRRDDGDAATLVDAWVETIGSLPAETVWAVAVECDPGDDATNRKGLLFHTGEAFGFVAWGQDFSIDPRPFAGASASTASESLSVDSLGERYVFSDAVSLRDMLPSPPHFSARVDSRRPFATISPLFNR